jgi:hypothetical protein
MGERDGQERAAQDGRVIVARRSGCTTSGWEGRRVGEGGRRGGCARGGRMRAVAGKENVIVFFIFIFLGLEKPCYTEGGAEEACWARSLDRSRNEPWTDVCVPALSLENSRLSNIRASPTVCHRVFLSLIF